MTAPVGYRTDPPGPRGYPLLGSLPDLWQDSLGTLLRGWQRYGDLVRFPLLGTLNGYLLARPEHIQHVLRDQQRRYRKSTHYHRLRAMLGDGLLTTEGEVWARQRRSAQPAFQPDRLARLGSRIVEQTNEMLDRWSRRAPLDEPLDLGREMAVLTLGVLGRAILGVDLGADAESITTALTIGQEHTSSPLRSAADWLWRLPLPWNLRFRLARRSLDNLTARLIRQASAHRDQADGLLPTLSQAGGSQRELHDQALTLLFAGHETTANALTWTWYLLGTHQEARERLQQELDQQLGGRQPDVADLPGLRYTGMVLQEALRLYPPIWAISREPIEDDQVGGYRIRAGSVVYLVPFITHRHPAYWSQPERFDPDRFTPEQSLGRPGFAYFPFGGGVRQCIGQHFAILETQLILTTIAQRFRLELIADDPPGLRPMIALRPARPVLARLRAV